jgi:tetratricopeptide (TPR) repeat protein
MLFVLFIGLSVTLAACATPTPTTIAPANAGPSATNTPTANPDAQPHLDAARAALKAGKFDVAITEAQAAITADAKSAQGYYLLGNAYNQLASTQSDAKERQANLAKAVDAYLKAINLDPQNDAAFTNLATVYYQTGQFDEAQTRVEQALKIKPDDATSHYVLGTIHLQRDPKTFPDALDKALAEFQAAIKSDPNMGAAYVGLANVYLFKNDMKLALENAQKGVDLSASAPNPYAYWALAQAQCSSGKNADGADTIKKIYTFSGADPLFLQQVQALADRCK